MLNRQGWAHDLAQAIALFAGYFAAGKLGLSLAYLNPSASAVWAPTGVALAAFLVVGPRIWPVIALAAFMVNVTTAGSAMTALLIAFGNTAEGFVGAWLVQRFAGGRHAFDRAWSAFAFVGLAAMCSTTISATVGVTTLAVAGYAPWSSYGWIWLTWWLGDAVGAIVVAPVLVLWCNDSRLGWSGLQTVELGLLALALVVVGFVSFGGVAGEYPISWLSIPIYTWAAFRFGPRKAATAVLAFSAIAIWGTEHGHGPFQGFSPHASLLYLQAFSGVTAASTLGLAAAVADGRRAEQRLQDLSVRDPLTGVANYRLFTQMLETELGRSVRTRRSCALVMLDLDKLKAINDTYGHPVGNEVLRRLAAAMVECSRAMDTTARYGGDEFALILPDADEDAARAVVNRIADRVEADTLAPHYSVSCGIAVYPRDGDTGEQLVAAADRALYGAKARRRATPRLSS